MVLLPFPFSDLSGKKVRPAVVLGGNSSGDLFLVPITSQPGQVHLPFSDWRVAGLNVPCGLKAQIATIEERLVLKKLGVLSGFDAGQLDSALQSWLSLA